MSLGITVQTVVSLHCDGPPHNYQEVVMDGHLSPSLVDDIRQAWGFTVTDDGRVFCRLHVPGLYKDQIKRPKASNTTGES